MGLMGCMGRMGLTGLMGRMGRMGLMGCMGRMGLMGRTGLTGLMGRMGLTDHARISKRTDSNNANPQKKAINLTFTAFSNNKI